MKIYKNPKPTTWPTLLKRPAITRDDISQTVSDIFMDVKHYGDSAIFKYSEMFDGTEPDLIEVTTAEIEIATANLESDLKSAIALAKSNITKFHAAQKTSKIEIETTSGVLCWQEKRAIQKVGLYIPGGSAPLFSTVLMLAIPAQIAGCTDIILCSPPDKNGALNPAILYAASICGVTRIFKVGGIQAIAALTFGTETVPKVYKIFGPGNQYVTAAKQFATQFGVAIDMPAGPSELLIFADDTANPEFVAADLLSQAEHGSDSQVILVSTSAAMIAEVGSKVEKQLNQLPRKELATQSIVNSKFILISSEKKALELINEYAPEHFMICCKNDMFFVHGITNAGSIFIGNYSPESAGDYASGTNHTLPTNGFARNYEGVNLDSFLKSMTFQRITEDGIRNIGESIEIMAEAEGLFAHKNAVTLRLNELKKISS